MHAEFPALSSGKLGVLVEQTPEETALGDRMVRDVPTRTTRKLADRQTVTWSGRIPGLAAGAVWKGAEETQ